MIYVLQQQLVLNFGSEAAEAALKNCFVYFFTARAQRVVLKSLNVVCVLPVLAIFQIHGKV